MTVWIPSTPSLHDSTDEDRLGTLGYRPVPDRCPKVTVVTLGLRSETIRYPRPLSLIRDRVNDHLLTPKPLGNRQLTGSN